MKKIHFLKNKVSISLLCILFLAFFLRFYHIGDFLFFGMDQEYEALLVKNILSGRHFPLIGVNASDTGLYLGPFFLYFAAIPFALFGGNPLGWAITASLIGVVVTYLIYRIGREMFSPRTGLFASLVYAGSYLTVFYDRQFWNPTLIPLFSLLTVYLIWKFINGHKKTLLVLSLVFGLALHSHLSILIFAPLIIYSVWKKWKHIPKKIVVYALLIFLITQLPLIIFDLRHGFLNLRASSNLFSVPRTGASGIFERGSLFLSAAGRFFLPSSFPDWFVESGQCKELLLYRKEGLLTGVFLLLGASVLFFFRKKIFRSGHFMKIDFRGSTNSSKRMILSVLFLTLLFLALYGRAVFEYYFLYLFPWMAIATGVILNRLYIENRWKMAVYLFLFIFLTVNIFAVMTSYQSYSYKDKKDAANYIKGQLNNQPYTLEALGECPRYGGYRYLFEYFVGKPVSSYMDSYFSWIYGGTTIPIGQNTTVLLSLIDPRSPQNVISKWQEDKLYLLFQNKIVVSQRFGNIQVYILKSGTK